MTEVSSGFISTCAGVGGGWRQIVNIGVSAGGDCPSGWRKATQLNVNFCRVVSDGSYTYSSATFPTNGTSYQKVCGRIRGYQKGRSGSIHTYHYGVRKQLIAFTFQEYQSLMAAHVNTFGLIQVDCTTTRQLNNLTVHVLLVEDQLLHHLWETTITVNQGLLTLYKVLIIFSMTLSRTDLAV